MHGKKVKNGKGAPLQKQVGENHMPQQQGVLSEDLSAVIRYHRKKSSLTQHELAKLAGLGKAVIFDIEKGKKTVQLDTILKVLKILNIEMRFFSPLMERFLREQDAQSESIRS